MLYGHWSGFYGRNRVMTHLNFFLTVLKMNFHFYLFYFDYIETTRKILSKFEARNLVQNNCNDH